ncbi:MAG: ABC transporter permease, partial [Acidobacteriaceae bacterium]
MQYRDKKVQNSILIGTLPAFAIVDDIQFQEGRPFTEDEEFRRADVTILGHDTAEKLFGTADPIGKDVVIGGDVFTVIGVLDKYKQLFGGGSNPEDNKAVFPMSTFHKIHPEILDTIIAIKYDDAKNKA